MLDGFLFSSSVETQQLGFRRIEHDFSDLNGLLNSLNSCKVRVCILPLALNRVLQWSCCPTQCRVLRVFLSLTGSGFQTSAALIYPNMGQVPPPPPPGALCNIKQVSEDSELEIVNLKVNLSVVLLYRTFTVIKSMTKKYDLFCIMLDSELNQK